MVGHNKKIKAVYVRHFVFALELQHKGQGQQVADKYELKI